MGDVTSMGALLFLTWAVGALLLVGILLDSFSMWLRMRKMEQTIRRIEEALMRR